MKKSHLSKLGLTTKEFVWGILFGVVFIYVATTQYFAIQENIAGISCRSVRKSINRALETYRTEHPNSDVGLFNKRINIEELIKAGNLKYYPECWDRGMYRVNDENIVYCTYHNSELGD